jgi:IclR helix-turn-helix domain
MPTGGDAVTDFLAEKRTEITDRMKTLEPAMEEFARLQAAAKALADVAGAPAAATSPNGRRRPGRPPAPKAPAANAAAKPTARKKRAGAKPAGRRGGRRKGSGERGTQALQVIVDKPGVTIPEIATETGIQQSYLYRVTRGLEQEGLVTKQGRGWHSAKVAA